MNAEIRGALSAVAFLTRLPLPRALAFDAHDLRRAGAYFPLVGATLGAASGSAAQRLSPEFGVIAATLATGAMHLDALADLADATGADGRERALQIMRDPRVGAFGATAIACDLILRSSALGRLATRRRAGRAGIAAGALSRGVVVALAAALPYAREGGGTGAALSGAGGRRAAAAAGLGLACAVAALPEDGLRLGVLAGAMATGSGLVLRHWLGGVTGDGLGATVALTETAVLVAAARR